MMSVLVMMKKMTMVLLMMTSNHPSSSEGIEEDGGIDGKQSRGVVGKENPEKAILNNNLQNNN